MCLRERLKSTQCRPTKSVSSIRPQPGTQGGDEMGERRRWGVGKGRLGRGHGGQMMGERRWGRADGGEERERRWGGEGLRVGKVIRGQSRAKKERRRAAGRRKGKKTERGNGKVWRRNERRGERVEEGREDRREGDALDGARRASSCCQVEFVKLVAQNSSGGGGGGGQLVSSRHLSKHRAPQSAHH